jgi:hypothetical protein
MQDNMYSDWLGGVMTFRDARYSPTKGTSLWDFAPLLATFDPAMAFFRDDDFLGAFDAVGAYTKTTTGAGSTVGLIHSVGGVVECATDASGSTASAQFQSNSEVNLLAAGKPAFFEARLNVSDATAPALAVGCAKTNTTLIAGTITDGVWFSKAAGSTSVSFNLAKASTVTTVTNVATLANGTNVKLGFIFDGNGNVTPYVNGLAVGNPVTTNIPNTQTITPSFAIQAGASAVKKLDVDYYQLMQVR